MYQKSEKEIISAVNEILQSHQDLRLENKDFVIRAFKNHGEIKKEGEVLRHAVIYYANRKLTKGMDYLFTMRLSKQKRTPYITLEFDPKGNLLLAKKLNNLPVTVKEELNFIEKFRRQVLVPFINSQGKRQSVLLYKTIISPDEYRRLADIMTIEDKSVEALGNQLNNYTELCTDIWWSPISDISLLSVRTYGRPLMLAIVSDGKNAIACEMYKVPTEDFVKIGEVIGYDGD